MPIQNIWVEERIIGRVSMDYERIVRKYSETEIEDCDIAELAEKLANSGDVREKEDDLFDFASTGGPSSLSTILVPLFIYAYGKKVINISVPGRPAGAIDVMSLINGYDISGQTMKKEVFKEGSSYFHFVAGKNLAPMDAELFEYRRQHGKVNVPSLAIASLLSKKIASGASIIGLDVRSSTFANFGKSIEECRINAERYNHVAKLLGLKSTCFITDCSQPYQGYIGRGESIMALSKIFNDDMDAWLSMHVADCKKMAQLMVGREDDTENSVKEAFINNLRAQGTDWGEFEDYLEKTKHAHKENIEAYASGYISYDVSNIRGLIVSKQNDKRESNYFSDEAGITLLKKGGEWVEKGEIIAAYRGFESLERKQIQSCIKIGKEMNSRAEGVMEV